MIIVPLDLRVAKYFQTDAGIGGAVAELQASSPVLKPSVLPANGPSTHRFETQ
jgi:hypothetical protein